MGIVCLLLSASVVLVGVSVIGMVLSCKAINDFIDGVTENEDK